MRLLSIALLAVSLAMLSGCSTDRHYTTGHECVISATIRAIAEEGHIDESRIERTDSEGGLVTTLKAPYIQYSNIEAKIDSRKYANAPELGVVVTTGEVLINRHKEWEQRIHEIVRLKMLARPHGHESRPTSLPQVKPVVRAPREPGVRPLDKDTSPVRDDPAAPLPPQPVPPPQPMPLAPEGR
jgi:hypothetical protein